jgi:hypothetical protein
MRLREKTLRRRVARQQSAIDQLRRSLEAQGSLGPTMEDAGGRELAWALLARVGRRQR